jgi:ribosomal protein S18 acetylase RimI-like enzyme
VSDTIITQLTSDAAAHRAAVTNLVWATGPVSYRYIFGSRERFDLFVGRSWQTPDTYFASTEASVALSDGAVTGLELGYDGVRNYATKHQLSRVSASLLADGLMSEPELAGLLERADRASYLNPYVPRSAYYILAIAVDERARGTGIGGRLFDHAAERGRRAGCRELHLDVLSDNPAVGFYRARGMTAMAETIAPEPCRVHGIPMELRMVMPL